MKRFITTPRLILRTPTPEDAPRIAEGRNTEFVMRYNLYGQSTVEQIISEIAEYESVIITLKDTGTVIGCIYIKDDLYRYHINSKELSGWVEERYANQGLMTEALEALMNELFCNENIDRLSTWVFSSNNPSRRLMRKVGFIEEGILKEACRKDNGQIFDVVLYSVGRNEYIQNKT